MFCFISIHQGTCLSEFSDHIVHLFLFIDCYIKFRESEMSRNILCDTICCHFLKIHHKNILFKYIMRDLMLQNASRYFILKKNILEPFLLFFNIKLPLVKLLSILVNVTKISSRQFSLFFFSYKTKFFMYLE